MLILTITGVLLRQVYAGLNPKFPFIYIGTENGRFLDSTLRPGNSAPFSIVNADALSMGIVLDTASQKTRPPIFYPSVETFHSFYLSLLFLIVVTGLVLFIWYRRSTTSKTEAVRRSENALAHAQAIAHLGSWVWDIPSGQLSWSDEIYRIMGLNKNEVSPTFELFVSLTHPDDRDKVSAAIDAALRGEKEYEVEHRINQPGGNVRYIYERGEIKFKAGKPVQMIGTAQDITVQKQNDEALRKSAEQIRDLYNNAPCGYHSLDKDGNFIQINDTELYWLGYSREEVIGKMNITDLIASDGLKAFQENFTRFKKRGWVRDLEFDMVRKNGSLLPVLLSSTAIKDAEGNFLMSRSTVFDNTERKEAEHSLRHSEARFRELFEQASDGIFVADLDGCYTDVNSAGCRMLGYTRDDIIGKTIIDLIPPSEVDRLWQSKEQLMLGGTHVAEWTLRRKDGTFLPVEVSAKILPDGRWQGFARDITQRKRVEEAVRFNEERVRLLLTSVAEGVFGVDLQGNCTFINPEGLRLLGYTNATDLVGKNIHARIHHTCADGTPCTIGSCSVFRAFREGINVHIESDIFWRPDGTNFAVEYRSRPILENGAISGAVATFLDISERKRNEERLHQAAIVFDSTNEAIMITDADNRIINVNRAFTEITGYQSYELIGKDPKVLQSEKHNDAFYKEVSNRLNKTGQWRGEIWDRRKNGEVFPVWENISVVKDKNDRAVNYVSVFSDISMIKESEQRLFHLAHHDPLTDIPNRLLFLSNLDQALEHAKRHRHKVGLLFLDLDRFKIINDTLGHASGDSLLQVVAERLRKCVRAEDTVARLGGDEFTVILTQIVRAEDAALLAEKIINELHRVIPINGNEVVTSTSIGISIFPDDAKNSSDLTKAADMALYRAKEHGRHNYQFYTKKLMERAISHMSVEHGLRRAITHGDFVLYYQPQVDLDSGNVVGVEALIRWNNPELGLLQPASFLPIAEESGLIEPIGEWVVRTACHQAMMWRAAGLPPVRMSVNVSTSQILRHHLIEVLQQLMEECQIQPGEIQLDLEITENVLQSVENNLDIFMQLKALNVTLAIDDFGTGYSSLSRLKRLPVDSIKIDKSFVHEIPDQPDSNAIANAIVAMAHSLKINVIAEGIENKAQLDYLQKVHCNEGQGYFFSEAVPPEIIYDLMKGGKQFATLR